MRPFPWRPTPSTAATRSSDCSYSLNSRSAHDSRVCSTNFAHVNSKTLLGADNTLRGRLAQLVRAPALQAGGRRFEPCTAHHDRSCRLVVGKDQARWNGAVSPTQPRPTSDDLRCICYNRYRSLQRRARSKRVPLPQNSGVVVQLVRTLPCHGRGRGFESRRPRHHNQWLYGAMALRIGRVLPYPTKFPTNRKQLACRCPGAPKLRAPSECARGSRFTAPAAKLVRVSHNANTPMSTPYTSSSCCPGA